MNQAQKRILVTMIVVVAAMLLYPPFQLVMQKGVRNMGYGWIFHPPQNGLATVNVPMLLLQWVGVLIIGGIGLFLTKTPQQGLKPVDPHPGIEDSSGTNLGPTENSQTQKQSANQRPHGPAGVGGWLGLLVVGLIVLGPLLGLGRLNEEITTVERQYQVLSSSKEWSNFKLATWVAFFSVAALSIYGGLGLAKGNKWAVVKRAIAVLWIIGPVATVIMGVLIPLIVFGNATATKTATREASWLEALNAGAASVGQEKRHEPQRTIGGLTDLVRRRQAALAPVPEPKQAPEQNAPRRINDLGKEAASSFIISMIFTAVWTAYLLKSKRVRNTYFDGRSANISE